MRKKFADLLANHPLRREIIATYVANTVVNRTGPAFVASVQENTGAAAADVARAYLVSREAFRAAELWAEVDALDTCIAAELQTEMRLDILALIKRGTRWFLRYGPSEDGIDAAVATYAPGIARLDKGLDRLLPDARRQTRDARAEHYVDNGAPAELATRIANLGILAAACDVVRIANTDTTPLADVARAHCLLGTHLGIDWLRESSAGLAVEGDRWRKAAANGLIDDLYVVQADLTAAFIAANGNGAVTADRVDAWLESRGSAVGRVLAVVADLRSAPRIDLPMLSVAAADMRGI
jgi:glutamate dehydrogenase